MLSPPHGNRISVIDYLRFDEQSEQKHEFHQGNLFEVSGCSLEHSQISVNAICEIGRALQGQNLLVLESHIRVCIPLHEMYCHPDVTVIDGKPEFGDQYLRQSVVNPKLIVEVISPQTESRDRGKKFTGYRDIPSFKEYVLISSDEPMIEVYYRQPDGVWRFTPARGLESSIALASIGITLKLAEVYAGVTLLPLVEQSDPPRHN